MADDGGYGTRNFTGARPTPSSGARLPRWRPTTTDCDVRIRGHALAPMASFSINGQAPPLAESPPSTIAAHDYALHLRPPPRRRTSRNHRTVRPLHARGSPQRRCAVHPRRPVRGLGRRRRSVRDRRVRRRANCARSAKAGVPVYFIRGNRDFLLGDDYARARRHGDPARPGGGRAVRPADAADARRPLCTDDVAYQQFRAQVRNPAWQQQFLSQPLAARLAFAQQARAASKAHQSGLQDQGRWKRSPTSPRKTVEATLARFGIDTPDPRPHPSPGDPRPQRSTAGAPAHRARRLVRPGLGAAGGCTTARSSRRL